MSSIKKWITSHEILYSHKFGIILKEIPQEDHGRSGMEDQPSKELVRVHIGEPKLNHIEDVMVEECLRLMQSKSIYQLPVVDKEKRPIGILRMLDLIGF